MKPAGLFLLALFALTWTLGFLWQPPASPESLWAFLAPLLPSVWAPTVIALLVMLATTGLTGARKEVRARLGYARGSMRWLVVAVLVPVIAVAAAVLAGRAAGDASAFISSASVLPMIGVQVVTGAVGEELGWRGFLLPRLGKRFGETTAAWIMAALWSLWHVPAWFNPSLPHQAMPMVSALLFIMFFGFFLAFVFNRAAESVLATICAHLSLNIMFGIGGVQMSSVVFWRTLAAVFGTLALMIVITARTRQRQNASSGVHATTESISSARYY